MNKSFKILFVLFILGLDCLASKNIEIQIDNVPDNSVIFQLFDFKFGFPIKSEESKLRPGSNKCIIKCDTGIYELRFASSGFKYLFYLDESDISRSIKIDIKFGEQVIAVSNSRKNELFRFYISYNSSLINCIKMFNEIEKNQVINRSKFSELDSINTFLKHKRFKENFTKDLSVNVCNYINTRWKIETMEINQTPKESNDIFYEIADKIEGNSTLYCSDLVLLFLRSKYQLIEKRLIEKDVKYKPIDIFKIIDQMIVNYPKIRKVLAITELVLYSEGNEFTFLKETLRKPVIENIDSIVFERIGIGKKVSKPCGFNTNLKVGTCLESNYNGFSIIYFLHPNCEHCKETNELIKKNYEILNSENFRFLSISPPLNESINKYDIFWKTNIELEGGFDNIFYKELKIDYTPAFAIINEDFRIICKPNSFNELLGIIPRIK